MDQHGPQTKSTNQQKDSARHRPGDCTQIFGELLSRGATLPTPTDPRVTLKEVPSRTLAALRWRGPSVKEEVMMSYAAELRSALEKEGIKMTTGSADAPPILFQYHPPFAPPWMRINEVLFEVTYE